MKLTSSFLCRVELLRGIPCLQYTLSSTHCPVHLVQYILSSTHYPVHIVQYILSRLYMVFFTQMFLVHVQFYLCVPSWSQGTPSCSASTLPPIVPHNISSSYGGNLRTNEMLKFFFCIFIENTYYKNTSHIMI